MWEAASTPSTPPRVDATQQQQQQQHVVPAALPDVSTTSPFRPIHQEAELEALRQRGLAKLLNKHFTETAAKLAKEKAAVDAALAELEQRKLEAAAAAAANTLNNNNHNQMTQMDDLYHRIHCMRAENRQKERETLLLYQRYVHKFGFTGKVQAPGGTTTAPAETKSTTAGCTSFAPSTSTAPVGSPTQSSSAAAAANMFTPNRLPSIAEPTAVQSFNSDENEDDDDNKITEDPADDNNNRNAAAAASAASTSTPTDPQVATAAENTLVAATETADARLDSEDEDKEEEEEQEQVHQLLSKYLDQDRQNDSSSVGGGNGEDEADELSSLISGLTSVDSATTRQILLDCEMTVATFLDEERKAIQHMMDEDSHNQRSKQNSKAGGASQSSPSIHSVGVEQAESMAQQMQQILQEFQQQAGLVLPGGATTSPAAGTTEDALTAATVFTAASPESKAVIKNGRPYPTSNPKEEWTVLWDETYKREYYHEKHSGKTQWIPPSLVKDRGGDLQPQQSLDPSDVMPDNSSLAGSSFAASSTSDRIAKYRAKRRRRRRKRILRFTAAVLLCAGSAGYYYYKYQYHPSSKEVVTLIESPAPQQQQQQQQEQPIKPEKQLEHHHHRHHQEQSPSIPRLEPKVTVPDTTPTAPPEFVAPKESISSSPSVPPPKAAFLVDEEPASSSSFARATEATTAKATTTAQQKDSETSQPWYPPTPTATTESTIATPPADSAIVVPAPPRPWGCNIPFAYVVSRKCRVLAKDQPVFDLHGLVQTMMQ